MISPSDVATTSPGTIVAKTKIPARPRTVRRDAVKRRRSVGESFLPLVQSRLLQLLALHFSWRSPLTTRALRFISETRRL